MQRLNKFFMWLAWKLPRRLAYFCAVRVGVNATYGEWEKEVVSEVKMLDALQRWH